ncbi:MAG: hypothetical protein ACYTEZ_02275 [Planctomycetota bacterium]|jgi:hypothetical protein
MPRIILSQDHLATIQQELKESRGVDFNTSNQEAVFSMLKYWCRETTEGRADVESVAQKESGYLVAGNADFLGALQKLL